MKIFKPTLKKIMGAILLTLLLFPLNTIRCRLYSHCPGFIPVSLLLNPIASLWGENEYLDFNDPLFYANLLIGFLIFYLIICISTRSATKGKSVKTKVAQKG